jgi:hypothetical protein
MTDQTRLDEIRARDEGATPGTWYAVVDDLVGGHAVSTVDHPTSEHRPTDTDVAWGVREPDADFISHAREDVHYLLDLVASLTKERDMWHDDATKLDAMAVKFETELTALRGTVEDARSRIFHLYRDGTLREDLDSDGGPLSEIHNLLAGSLTHNPEGDEV